MKYPITPEYIQAAGEYLTPLYQSLEDYVIDKICEQFQTGEANATALELIRELQRRGLDLKDIEKQSGHPSIKGMKAFADQVGEAITK